MSYGIKNLKTFRGMEGTGFNVDLHRGGKKVAFVFDAGNGGETSFEWVSEEEEKAFNDYCAAQPSEVVEGNTLPPSPSLIICRIIDEREVEAQYRKMCRRATAFRLKGDTADQWRILKAAFSPAVERLIQDRFGDSVEEILNKRFA